MSRLKFALLCIVIGLPSPAAAQERVLVGTQRLAENGALFLAAAQGYFKAEGIDLGMTAYESDQAVAESLAAGTTDFGLAGFTPAAFNAGGKGLIKAIAAQVREKRYYEGSELVASNFGLPKDCVRLLMWRTNPSPSAHSGPPLTINSSRLPASSKSMLIASA
jgi:NMT1/THI5 like